MGDFSVDKLFLFILFALPGAVAIRVYSLWCPVPQKDWKESISDAVIYSSIGVLLWFFFVPTIVKQFISDVAQKDGGPFSLQSAYAVVDNCVGLGMFVFVTPTVLSSTWYFLRLRVCHRWLGIDHPIRTAWDWIFSRKHPHYILFFMKSQDKEGKQVILAGYFNGRSYVTSYPLDPEIYVERVHEFTPEGKIGLPIPDTNGMLIKMSECEHMQFLVDPTPIPLSIRQRVLKWSSSVVNGTTTLIVFYAVSSYEWSVRRFRSDKGGP